MRASTAAESCRILMRQPGDVDHFWELWNGESGFNLFKCSVSPGTAVAAFIGDTLPHEVALTR